MRAFDFALYPAAVALATAGRHDDVESFETILAEAGADIALPLVELLCGSLILLAAATGEPFDVVLGRVGTFAAEAAAGTL
jgi:hypothetical protein